MDARTEWGAAREKIRITENRKTNLRKAAHSMCVSFMITGAGVVGVVIGGVGNDQGKVEPPKDRKSSVKASRPIGRLRSLLLSVCELHWRVGTTRIRIQLLRELIIDSVHHTHRKAHEL